MAIGGQRFTLSAGSYRAEISEVGAGLAGLWHDDLPITTPYPDWLLSPMSSGAVLLPWPNRIRDGKYRFDGRHFQLPLTEPLNHNASHGLVRWERWAELEQQAAVLRLGLDLVPQTGYPFELRAQLIYRLTGGGGLSVEAVVTNIGSGPAPFGLGFHPYLDLDGTELDHAELEIPAGTRLIVDDQLIPVEREPVVGTPYDFQTQRPLGTLRLDTGFADLTASLARLTVAGRTVSLWWDEQFGSLQVFTPPVQRFGRPAVAIEPMTCPADAFNSGAGLIELEPGASWSASWGIGLR